MGLAIGVLEYLYPVFASEWVRDGSQSPKSFAWSVMSGGIMMENRRNG